jgi:hypothetical protein
MQGVNFSLREDLDTLPSKQCCGHAKTIARFTNEASVVKESTSAVWAPISQQFKSAVKSESKR